MCPGGLDVCMYQGGRIMCPTVFRSLALILVEGTILAPLGQNVTEDDRVYGNGYCLRNVTL